MIGSEEDVRTALRRSGLRITAQRVAVLETLRDGGHLLVDDIVDRVRERLGTVSQQAVYNVLASLTAAGLARRVEPAGSPSLYEARAADNHHHIVCRDCGLVADVDCAVGAAPCLEASDTHGFRVDEAEVTYWGICPDCQHARQTPSITGVTRREQTDG